MPRLARVEIIRLFRLLPIWEVFVKRGENVFAQLDSVAVARGASTLQCFFNGADCARKVSRLSVSRTQRVENNRDSPLGQITSALGKSNCLDSVARFWIRIRRQQPRQFVEHSW